MVAATALSAFVTYFVTLQHALLVIAHRDDSTPEHEILRFQAELEVKDATIRALHRAYLRTRKILAGRRLDEYDWSTDCSDSTTWHKMGDSEKDW